MHPTVTHKQVSPVIKQILDTVQAADATVAQHRLTIVELDLDLKGRVTTKGGLRDRFVIPIVGLEVGGGGDVAGRAEQTIKMRFISGPGAQGEPAPSGAQGSVETEELDAAVKDIRLAIEEAAEGIVRFDLKRASVELNFAIEATGKLNFGVEADRASKATHTLTLTLE